MRWNIPGKLVLVKITSGGLSSTRTESSQPEVETKNFIELWKFYLDCTKIEMKTSSVSKLSKWNVIDVRTLTMRVLSKPFSSHQHNQKKKEKKNKFWQLWSCMKSFSNIKLWMLHTWGVRTRYGQSSSMKQLFIFLGWLASMKGWIKVWLKDQSVRCKIVDSRKVLT